MITMNKPPYIVSPGNTSINGSATEYTSGSGIKQVKITIADETIFDKNYTGEHFVWFEWHFTADLGETYDIFVKAWDAAGNMIEDRRTVQCPNNGLYEPGYIYLFNSSKMGPVHLLRTLGLSIAVNYNTLYVVLPGISGEVASVKFTATQVFLGKLFEFTDVNMTDGCSANLLVPLGIYSITAYAYDSNHNQLAEYPIIAKMLIVLL
jgi:hypothetical protein